MYALLCFNVSLSLLATYVNPSFLSGRLHTEGGVVFFLMALGLLAFGAFAILEGALRRMTMPTA